MDGHEPVRHGDETAARLSPKSCDDLFDIGLAMDGGREWLHAEFYRGSFHGLHIDLRIWGRLRIEHHGDPRYAGRDLLKQIQPLAADRRLEIDEAGDVATGTRQALDQASADRIRYSRKHDRNCLRLAL